MLLSCSVEVLMFMQRECCGVGTGASACFMDDGGRGVVVVLIVFVVELLAVVMAVA